MKLRRYILVLVFAFSLLSCTIAIISGDITSCGRPIIFKIRGVDSWDIEFKTVNPADGFRYSANTYTGENTVWMGVNEAGFGIVQSAALNITGIGLDNGRFMTEALRRCITIEDFAAMIDSTDEAGRSTRSNYGVMDYLGNIAMFECGHGVSQRYDHDSLGFIVRSNYAFIGDTTGWVGPERMDRAEELMHLARETGSMDVHFIANNIMGDITRNGQNPYPLPFLGQFGDLDPGWVNTDSSGRRSLSSHRTTSAVIIRGVLEDEDPALSVAFCYYGTPPVGIPFVLVPKATYSPAIIEGEGSLLRNVARRTWFVAYHDENPTLLDTRVLLDESHSGMWEYSQPVMNWVFDTSLYLFDLWNTSPPSVDEVIALQDTIAERVYSAYNQILSAFSIAESVPQTVSELATMYPNPFHHRILIDVSYTPEAINDVNIYSVNGRLLYSRQITNTSNIVVWTPGKSLPAGLYFVEIVKRGGERQTHRIFYMK